MNPRQKRSPRSSSPQDASSQKGKTKRVSGTARKLSGGRLQGAALVIVLAFLVIMTGLVVAFLSSVTNEATATSASAAGVTTRSLADAAIQLDIAQIRDATAGFSHDTNGSLLTTSPVCWASQPGAIRTYDTNGNGGSSSGGSGVSVGGGGAIYKLYSSTNMVDTAGGNPTNDLPTSSAWISNTALFTDLNAPVKKPNGDGTTNTNYPIMDPYMTNLVTGGSGGGGGVSFGSGQPIVDGFSIDTNVPCYYSSNPAAMPVVWLYILKNGTLIKPDAGSSTTATFANASTQPASNNPIVGRIAFWTDDETSKLNINTASEGSFWGVPSFSTSLDQAFAQFPPAGTEYNRFPGHPASTSLSPVLWSCMGLSNPAQLLMPNPNNTNGYNIAGIFNTNTSAIQNFNSPSYISTTQTNYLTNLFTNVVPRYAWGGSFGGITSMITNPSTLSGLTGKTNRLYASVDELFFSATNSSGATNGRTNNLFVASGSPITNTALLVSRLRFFLTGESRAPEVNPFNLPKICLWPVPDTNNAIPSSVNPSAAPMASSRTILDQTIAYCTTLGSYPYYFTRYDASSQNNDFNGRNQTLYSYLRNLLNQPSIPGFKGRFTGTSASAKWGNYQGDQLSTEIYDYIRSCINLCDSSMATNAGALTSYTFSNSYTVPPSGGSGSITLSSGSGQVVPIQIPASNNISGKITQGMGRFLTLKGGTLWFVAAAANQPPLLCHPDGKPIVFDQKGNPISTNIAGVSMIITNAPYTAGSGGSAVTYPRGPLVDVVLLGNTGTYGVAYAKINPMHPWTTPYTNNYGFTMGPVVPQLTNVAGGQSCAVLADLNSAQVAYSSGTSPNKATNDPTSLTNIYPIFVLSTNNGLPAAASNSLGGGARSYASYNINTNVTPNTGTMITYLTNTVSPVNWYVATNGKSVAFLTNSSSQSIKHYVVGLTPSLIGAGTTNLTHAGLPFLTIQNTNSGAFNIVNGAYYYGSKVAATMAAFPPHTTQVELAYLPNFACVTPGSFPINPRISNLVTGLSTIAINGTTLDSTYWPATTYLASTNYGNNNQEASYLYDLDLLGVAPTSSGQTNALHTTKPFAVPTTNSSGFLTSFPMTCSAGGTTIPLVNTVSSLLGSSSVQVQSATLNFPTNNFPIPHLPPLYGYVNAYNTFPHGNTTVGTNDFFTNSTYNLSMIAGNKLTGYYGVALQPYLFPLVMSLEDGTNGDVSDAWNNFNLLTADTIQSVDLLNGDPRMTACLTNITSDFFTNNPLYGITNALSTNGWNNYLANAHSLRSGARALNGGNYGTLLFTNGTNSYFMPPIIAQKASQFTNLNLAGIPASIQPYTTNMFGYCMIENRTTNKNYVSGNQGHGSRPYAGPFCNSANTLFWSAWTNGGDFDNGIGYFPDGPYMGKVDEGFGSTNYGADSLIGISPYYNLGGSVAGAACFSPNRIVPSPLILGSLPVGISSTATNILTNAWRTFQFSPNPNAVGTNGWANRCTAAGYNMANGLITNLLPPDHLILDFFQMPVVQPYPISDPFSTAGKVNMNYQIAPFAYINRDSAMRGALKSVLITAVDARWGYDYKLRSTNSYQDNTSQNYSDTSLRSTNTVPYNLASSTNSFEGQTAQYYFHYPVHLGNTLAQFTNRFSQNDLFHSPSEICSLWLYPAQQPSSGNPLANTNAVVAWDAASANITSWWYGTNTSDLSAKSLTGGNLRQRPYSYLYPRLTTKSNTYQIHYRVQTLKQNQFAHSSDAYATWVDPSAGGITDKVLGEQRGSAVIERFIDPSNPSIPDFASAVTSGSGGASLSSTNCMDSFYQFRVFNAKQFTP